MKRAHANALGLLISFSVFPITNYFHFRRAVTCYDGMFPYGLPFTLDGTAGFAGGNGVVWSGIFLDTLIILASGMCLGFLLLPLFVRSR